MNMKWAILLPIISLLNACSWNTPTANTREMIYPINNPYPEEDMNSYQEARPLPKFVKTAEVPQTHISAKNIDNQWITAQNPESYTIMLIAKEQPLVISQELMEIPKNQRSAAVKYERFGKVYYTGVYGNFNDAQQAQQSLESLPSNLREQAQVVQWNKVQNL